MGRSQSNRISTTLRDRDVEDRHPVVESGHHGRGRVRAISQRLADDQRIVGVVAVHVGQNAGDHLVGER